MSSSSGTYESCLAELTSISDGNDGIDDSGTNNATDLTTSLLNCITSKIDTTIDSTHNSIDTFFLLYAATLVFFMQAGFAMICAGCVRTNNVQNTLLKNLLDACGASLGFYTVGYAFAWGGSASTDPGTTETTFIGTGNFFMMGVENDSFWLFQFAFCATSATIVAGTLAERCQMAAYVAYSVMLSGFVYPVVVHSVWSPAGFLSANKEVNPLWGSGMVDFAGSTVVHLTGGLTALIATNILGPRTGRFYDMRGDKLEVPKEFPGHSLALQMLGTFILWFGWYGFNTGSTLSIITTANADTVSAVAINTTLSAASATVMALFLHTLLVERYTGEVTFNLQYAMNGCLAGLASITAGCSTVESWAAIVIGLVAGALYLWTSLYLVKRCIDDAVDAIPVHMTGGIWGSLAVGLLAEPSRLERVYGRMDHVGWFYEWARGSGDGTLLACQIVGILFVCGWVLAIMGPFFWGMRYLGWLRADSLEEVVGLDIGYTGGILHKRMNANDEVENNMDEYVKEYLKRREERLYIKNQNRSTRGSTLLGVSLHGVSHLTGVSGNGGNGDSNGNGGNDRLVLNNANGGSASKKNGTRTIDSFDVGNGDPQSTEPPSPQASVN